MLASTKQPKTKMASQTHPPVNGSKKKALKGANNANRARQSAEEPMSAAGKPSLKT